MDDKTSYWLKVGEGHYQYTSEVSMETYMAMERVCGLREEVPPDRVNLPVTVHFMNPSSPDHLKVEGWVWDGIFEVHGTKYLVTGREMERPVSDR